MKAGKLITFEGIDGCGKTTQIELISQWLKQKGSCVLKTLQPGGTGIGQQIREILLNRKNKNLVEETEMLLYLADRIQHLKEVILPSIEQGKMVLCDRFHDSTIAYQGHGRGLDLSLIKSIEEKAINPYPPDLTFLFIIDPEIALKRIDQSTGMKKFRDRLEMEPLEFFKRVSDGYNKLAKASPMRFVCIDGNAKQHEIHQIIKDTVKKKLIYSLDKFEL